MFTKMAGKVVLLGSMFGGLGLVVLAGPVQGQERHAASPNSVRQGIQVHGHWLIEVRNSDGSVSTRREFENALTSDGARQLVGWMVPEGYGGGSTGMLDPFPRPVSWMVGLRRTTSFVDSFYVPGVACTLPPSISSATGVITAPVPTGMEFPTLQLSGSLVESAAVSIQRVEAYVLFADRGSCSTLGAFTVASLATPVEILAGQTVAVTVTFSFQ